jgi:DNA-directed RNA polymerase specialized sigma24 family protein
MPMDSDDSVTQWIGQLKRGDRAAAPPLWQAYFHRLVALARDRLRGAPRGAADEEDVALAAFDSFYRRAERGQFPKLDDRNDLWHLVSVITVRKAIDAARREARRSGRAPRATSKDWAEWDVGLALSTEPTPELAATIADEYRRLLERLGNESLRAVALMQMEGFSNGDIAARLGIVESSVARKLRRIRELWIQEGTS